MEWLTSRLNAVRVRQIVDDVRHSLLFTPLAFVAVGVVLSQVILLLDRQLSTSAIPDALATTVPSARTLLAAIAGGLITSITLLMSIALVAVQLASSQFSPRTLRNWLGNRVLQRTIGLALGTTVFCLLGLRSARSFDEATVTVPHLTVLVALALGIGSLIAVVWSVDHVTRSLQIGTVAASLARDTIEVIKSEEALRASAAPIQGRRPSTEEHGSVEEIDFGDGNAYAVTATRSGFVQQIDTARLVEVMPDDSTLCVVPSLGSFVMQDAPLLWLVPVPPEDHPCRNELAEAFAIGDSRTMQQDIGFGLAQLTDIAVRALSPGVNDPRTAMEIVLEIGEVLRQIWSYPAAHGVRRDGSRTVIRAEPEHQEYLRAALGPIARYGRSDPDVTTTIVATLVRLRDEAERTGLPGPIPPIDDLIDDVSAGADSIAWNPYERAAVASAMPERNPF